MSRLDSFFVADLDDPGDWTFQPILTAEQQRQLLRFYGTTTNALRHRLNRELGVAARAFDLEGFLHNLMPARCSEDDIRMAQRLLMIQEYSAHRGRAPAMAAGGTVSNRNQSRWKRWQPWLQQQLLAAAQQNAEQSLLWRCHLVRVPQQWLGSSAIAAGMRQQLQANSTMQSLQIEELQLELQQPTPGGLDWIEQAHYQELNRISTELSLERTVIIELIRDGSQLQAFSDLAVAFALDSESALQSRLHYAHPTLGQQILQLAIGENAVRVIADSAQQRGMADCSVKAFRLWRRAGSTAPPWFGVRRYVPTLIPWGVFWWLRHGLKLKR